jgi:hypothetical protein
MIPVPGWDNSGGGSGAASGSSGPEDPTIAGKNLRQSNNLSLRPLVMTEAHLYNLRNQTWAIPRYQFNAVQTPTFDTIQAFINNSSKRFPSNSDDVNAALYANTSLNYPSNLSELYKIRFNAVDLVGNPPGNMLAPMGYFIIDALARGSSRIQAITQLQTQYPQLTWTCSSLPGDFTPGGPTCVAEFAGHVFYGGFSGELQDGDDNSPRMSSYILFSQLVTDLSNIGQCYQQADPTNKDDSELVDTDGGFVRIDGAYGICALVNVENALVVLGYNGIWIIQGANNYGFKATDYLVTKISTHGCVSPASVVVVDNALMYWGDDGIYNVSMDQFGDWTADNVTIKTINTLYNNIPNEYKQTVSGSYDSYEKKVRWVYGNIYNSADDTYELVLDLILGAYYKNVITKFSANGGTLPMVIGAFNTDPFQLVNNEDNVTVNGVQVTELGSPVIITNTEIQNVESEVKYLIITGTSPTVQYSFGTYNQAYHYDWVTIDPADVGIDATSILLTGAMTGGDTQRKKTVTYITTHFQQTESGYSVLPNGDWQLNDQSGCQLQSQWDWTNSATSGNWGQSQEVYRFRRQYVPTSLGDTVNNGYSVVETRSKLRGTGRALSLLLTSEPGKHMHLYGWALQVTANQNV